MSEVSARTGLPDIPAIQKYWQPLLTYPATDALDWVIVAPADPSRWLINFSQNGNGLFIVTTDPDTAHVNGWRVNDGEGLTFEANKFGALVGLQWYAWGGGGIRTCMVYTNAIRLRT